jgi:hypothetical protein
VEVESRADAQPTLFRGLTLFGGHATILDARQSLVVRRPAMGVAEAERYDALERVAGNPERSVEGWSASNPDRGRSPCGTIRARRAWSRRHAT